MTSQVERIIIGQELLRIDVREVLGARQPDAIQHFGRLGATSIQCRGCMGIDKRTLRLVEVYVLLMGRHLKVKELKSFSEQLTING